MRAALCFFRALVAAIGMLSLACGGLEHFDEGGGGGGGGLGGGGRQDAGLFGDGAGSARIRGTLCLLGPDRLADRGPCQPLTGTSLTVSAGAGAVTAAPDGRFDAPSPGGAAALVTVAQDATYFGAAARVTLDENGGAAGVELAILTQNDLAAILAGSGVSLLPGNGLLAVQVDEARSMAPVANVQMSVVDGVAPYYDTQDPLVYAPGPGTAQKGTGVYFNLAPRGAASVTLSGTGSPQTITAPVAADALVLVGASL